MAGTIKGISVSIGGNTVDLQSSLKDVEKISRNLQSELTQVNKQLKFDPSNSVLLAQKQDILEERIANTKLTLEKLLAVQDQVEEQAKTGELGADKYRAYQREIESTKGVLKNLEQQLKKTREGFEDLNEPIEKTGFDKFQTALDESTKSSKTLEDELKKVDDALKLDPSNSVLVAQKQEILEERIKKTKDALLKYDEVREEIESEAKSGTLGEDKYRAYQREIENTKNVLKKLENELEDSKDAVDKLDDEVRKSQIEDYKKKLDSVKESASELKDTLKDTATEIGTGVAAVAGAGAAALMSFDSVESALNHIQASTGLDTSSIEKYRDVLESLYQNNYGESMDDLASKMANVVQFTNETNPAKIEKYVQNLSGLEDTFQYDIAESLRAVNMLMDQFGISADEAFNLIVQGSQKGLNKNGDLLDTINEYSVHYKQLGYSAEEFFNSLENGAASGTFSIDKLGDAMKEFGIRSKDTSTTTSDALALLGYSAEVSAKDINDTKNEITDLEKKLKYAELQQQSFNEKTSELTKQKNADNIAKYSSELENAKKKLEVLTDETGNSQKSISDLQDKFAEGGESAREATQEVLEQLFAMDDKVLQNQAGVALFGSMWEDLGIDGVKALMDVNGTADKTVSSMEKLNEVKYDDVQSKLKTLGKKAQTEIINPLIKDAYPKIEDGVEWITDNLDSLIPILEGLARQAALVWGVKKITDVVKSAKNLYDNYKKLTVVTDGAANAQKGLNFAQKANVVAAIATAVLTLINAVNTYQETQWENSSLKKEIDNIKECTDEWNSLADDISSFAENINETEIDLKVNFENVEKMKERLQEIVKDGTIDESEKGEYKTIIDLLGEKVDGFKTHWNNLTLEDVDGEIKITDNIDDVNRKLDDLVEDWEITQAKLTFTNSYSSLQTEAAKKEAEVKAIDRSVIDTSKKELVDYIFESSGYSKKESQIIADELEKQKGDIEKVNKNLKDMFKKKEIDYSNHPNLSYQFDTGGNFFYGFNWNEFDAEKRIKEYTDSINENQDAVNKAESELETLKGTCDDYQKKLVALNNGQADYNTLIALSTEHGMSHEAVLSLVKDKNIKTWDDLLTAAEQKGTELAEKSKEKARNATRSYDEFKPRTPVKRGLDEAESAVEESGVTLSEKTKIAAINAQNSAKISGWFGVGSNFIANMISGIFSKNTDSNDAGKTAAEEARTGAGGVSLFQKGVSLISGFISGIGSKKEDSKKAGESVAKKTETGASSVSLFSLGDNLVGGFINGIKTGEAFKKIGEAAKSVAKNAYDSIKSWLGIKSPSKETEKLGKYFSEGFAIGIDKNSGLANSAASELAKTAHNNLKKINISNTLGNLQTLQNANTGSNISTNTTKTITNTPTINVNVSGVTINNDTDIDTFANRISERLGDLIVQDGSKWG